MAGSAMSYINGGPYQQPRRQIMNACNC